MKKYIYFHVATVNHWKDVVGKIFSQIVDSGVYDEIDEIRLSVVGDIDEVKNALPDKVLPKCRFVINLNSYLSLTKNWLPMRRTFKLPMHNEELVFQHIQKTASKEDCYILYMHAKGITHTKKSHIKNIGDWIDYLLHFNLYRHKEVFSKLQEYDAVGCEIIDRAANWGARFVSEPENIGFERIGMPSKHSKIWYKANFWWAKSSHIKKLSPKLYPNYSGPELWLTAKPGKFLEMWHANIDHLRHSYSKSNYSQQNSVHKEYIYEKI